MLKRLGLSAFTLVWLAAFAVTPGAATVPNPTVIGPIPATAVPGDPSHNYPFFATTVDLAAYGYVEEEFFLQGTANRYNTPTMPPATGSIIDSGHLYKTRIIVRRPTSPHDFNGTVLMEWQNTAPGHDIDIFWLESHDHLIRRGYAWVGVSVSRAGVNTAVTGLRAWSPNRYGTLDVTQGGTILDDALSYDIFSQAAQAVRSPVGVDPMGELNVERVFAIGGVPSLATYYNSIHPLAGVFDAFSIDVVAGGLLRTDLNVKVFKLLSEYSIALGGQAPSASPTRTTSGGGKWRELRTLTFMGGKNLRHSWLETFFLCNHPHVISRPSAASRSTSPGTRPLSSWSAG